MKRIIRYAVIPVIAALLVAGATFFVVEADATVSGFPIPYATFHPCCSGGGDAATGLTYYYDNTYVYNTVNFVIDVAAWLVISLAAMATFTRGRFLVKTLLSGVAGAAVTVFTFLLTPLSISAWASAETVQIPTGFPYAYAIHYHSFTVGLLASTVPIENSGYIFSFSAALADFAFWTLITYFVVGLASRAATMKHNVPLDVSPAAGQTTSYDYPND